MKLQLILLDDLFYRGTGPTGPTGPTSSNILRASYLVLFNNIKSEDGIRVESNERIPISRIELDFSDLITLNDDNTINFNMPGYYKISFTVSAYPVVESAEFDPTRDIVAIGFRQIDTDNTYVGVGQWVFNGEAVELYAQGIVAIPDLTNKYEIVNLSKQPIYLNTPSIDNVASLSYFSNSLLTVIIEYLGLK